MDNTALYYKILHLAPGASPEEVKRAYRALVKRYHPDRVPEKYKQLAEAKLRQVIAAYAALTKHHMTGPLTAPRKKAARPRPSAWNGKNTIRNMTAQNDNAPRRTEPSPWRTIARAGWSNVTEILWPIAPPK